MIKAWFGIKSVVKTKWHSDYESIVVVFVGNTGFYGQIDAFWSVITVTNLCPEKNPQFKTHGYRPRKELTQRKLKLTVGSVGSEVDLTVK